jgi:hypothetical protein
MVWEGNSSGDDIHQHVREGAVLQEMRIPPTVEDECSESGTEGGSASGRSDTENELDVGFASEDDPLNTDRSIEQHAKLELRDPDIGYCLLQYAPSQAFIYFTALKIRYVEAVSRCGKRCSYSRSVSPHAGLIYNRKSAYQDEELVVGPTWPGSVSILKAACTQVRIKTDNHASNKVLDSSCHAARSAGPEQDNLYPPSLHVVQLVLDTEDPAMFEKHLCSCCWRISSFEERGMVEIQGRDMRHVTCAM